MAATIGTNRGFRYIAKAHISSKFLNVLRRAFQQERIPHPHNQIFDLVADVFVTTMHSKRVDAIATTQAHLAQLAPNHPRFRGNQHFDCGGFNGRQLVHPTQFFVPLQAQQLCHRGPQHNTIPDLQGHTRQITPQRLVATHHVNQPHAFAFEQLNVEHFTTNKVRFRWNDRFGKEPHPRTVRQKRCHARAIRQEFRTKNQQISHRPERNHKANGRDLKDRERLHPRLTRHTIDQQVCRGPDQCHRAANDRAIRQWDQQFRRRNPQCARELHKDRQHDDDHGRVVHKGRGHKDKAHQTSKSPFRTLLCMGLGKFCHPREGTRAHQSPHDDKHRRNGPRRRVRKRRNRNIIGQNTCRQHESDTRNRHDFGGIGFPQEHDEHADNDQQRDDGLTCLRQVY